MKKIKKLVLSVLCLSLVMGSITVYAAVKTKTARCPACNHNVTSYGVDEIYSTEGHYVYSGNKCPGCGQTVLTGTKHWYYTNIELYYFTCNDVCCRNKNLQSRTFTVPFKDSTPRGHEIITTN